MNLGDLAVQHCVCACWWCEGGCFRMFGYKGGKHTLLKKAETVCVGG